MTLGETVRSIRLEQGLSQKEAAEAAGIDQSYLSMIESGQRRNPGTRIVARLAKVLDVSMDELAARAGYLSNPRLADPLSQRAMRLFRRLPRWRQEDVLAQLELYLERQDVQQRIVRGEERELQTEERRVA